jgi:hypothetical protein
MSKDHLTKLADIATSNLSEAQKERQYKRIGRERWKEIMDAPPMLQHCDFFCRACDKDVTAPGYKSIKGTQSDAKSASAFYLGRCPKDHALVRYITDKHNDPYFALSKNVRFLRLKHEIDMLTPSDPRFKYHYPAQWRELEARREEYERTARH